MRWTRADAGAAALVAALALALSWGPLSSLDWGWHLATWARWIAEGRLPVDDRFAWGSEGPYQPVHLVFQIGLGTCYDLLGLPGLIVFRELLVLAFGLALLWGLRRRGAGPWTAAALVGAVLAGAEFRLTTRPHLFTFLFLVLLLDALLAVRDRGLRHPLRLPLLFAVWANAHPGVVFGVALAWGFALMELGRALWARRGGPAAPLDPAGAGRLLGWVAAGTAATCLNPLGPGLYPYLLAHRDMQARIDVVELRGLFQEGAVASLAPHVLLTGLFLGGVALALRKPRALDPTLGGATLAFAVLGVVVARSAPLALVLLAFLLAPRLRARAPAWLFGVALLIPGAPALSRALERPGGLLFPGRYPVRAADWLLEHHPQGRIYNSNSLGGYLVFRLAPAGMQVHTDGRMPLFLNAIAAAKHWKSFEARYAPAVLVLDWGPPPRADGRTFVYEPELPRFRAKYALVFVGNGAKVYLRRGAGNDALIERYGYHELGYYNRDLARPDDPARFRDEVQRARREDPELQFLPGR